MVRLGFARRGDVTEACETFQSGCLRVRMPRLAAGACEAVILNTGGGLAGGDRLDQRVRWDQGARATVTTQAAEKVYRTVDEAAAINTVLDVADDAEAEWLPQETILFDHARLRRRMEIRLAPGARFLGLEAVVLGRTAMGERVISGLLDDRWRISRAGRPIYADALRLDGGIEAQMQRAAAGAGAAAMAVIVHISDRAGALLARVRDALRDAAGLAAATAYGSLLVVRLLAREGQALRRDIAAVLLVLRGGAAVPRVWGC